MALAGAKGRFSSPHAAVGAVLAGVALASLGICAISTAAPQHATAQLKWLLIALAVGGVCVLPHPRRVGIAAFPLMVVSVILLAVVVFPAMPRSLVPVRNGATCWINLYFMMFQPSELAKIAFVLALARYLRYRRTYRTLPGLLVPFVLMFIPVGLILKEPDLGTALIFAPALFAVLVAAGARLRHLGVLVGLGVLVIVANIVVIYTLPNSMQVLKPHQRQRIVAMISQAQGDNRYVKDIGYQQDKAMTLVGAGGALGYGAQGAATMVRFNRLPEDHNDMIFAVVVNRWGLVGGAGMIGLYVVLVGSFLMIAGQSRDPFARLATVGFAGLLFSQAAINIGMTVGLLPITGITLPFVSYGGSSLVATFAMVGLTVNFASHRAAILSRPSFEFEAGEVNGR